MTDEEARRVTLALVAGRPSQATVCPSEVARALASASGVGRQSEDWRGAMPLVHAAIDRLLAEGLVQLSWKGRKLEARAGPYRVGRPEPNLKRGPVEPTRRERPPAGISKGNFDRLAGDDLTEQGVSPLPDRPAGSFI